MNPSVLLVYNPDSGKRRVAQMLEPILTNLSRAGAVVTALPVGTTPTRKLLQERRYDALVCCGGDGTLHYAVNDVLAVEKPIPVGYFPFGSTNDFAASLGLVERSIPEACAAITALRARKLDVGRANGQAFCYVAAFGMFTDVSYQTSQEAKNLLGHFAYIAEGVRRLNLDQGWKARVQADGLQIEGEFWYGSVTNTTYIGGMQLPDSLNVSMDDGQFEVILIRRPQNVAELQRLVTCLMTQKPDGDLLRFARARSVRLHLDAHTPFTLDGEEGPQESEITIDVLPQAISLLM